MAQSSPLGAAAPATASPVLQGEITIVIDSIGRYSKWQGSRAQPQAEGIAPPGTEWPAEWEMIEWQADSLRYSLRRDRPPAAKGPHKAFADCDWWILYVCQSGRPLPSPIERKMSGGEINKRNCTLLDY